MLNVMKGKLRQSFKVLPCLAVAFALPLSLTCLSARAGEPKWEEIILHHTATPKTTKSGRDYPRYTKDVCDEQHRQRGWDECGYAFLVNRDGFIAKGRSLAKAGAHCLGKNRTAIGVAFVMDGRREFPTKMALDAFKGLKSRLESILRRKLPVSGHRDHRATVCPTDNLWNAL